MRLRTGVLLALASLGALFLVPFAAGAATAAPLAYPVKSCSTLSISTTRPAPGEAITISGSGFVPHVRVLLVLDTGLTLASVYSNGGGAFRVRFTLPQNLQGNHTITASGGSVNARSCPLDPVMQFAVQGASAHRGGGGNSASTSGSGAGSGGSGTGSGGLSFTGVDVLGMIAVAAALILSGAVLNGRRRPRARAARVPSS